MGELSLKRRETSSDSVVMFSKSNILPLDNAAGTGSIYGSQTAEAAVSMLGLTASNKSGQFVIKNYDLACDVNNNKYSNAFAIFTIDGACRLPGNGERTYIDPTTGYGYGQRSCLPSVIGVLTNVSDSCSIKVPIAFESVRATYTAGSVSDTLSWESETRNVWAEGEMTFDVSFGTDEDGKRILIVDWLFDGDVDNAKRAAYGTPTAETIPTETYRYPSVTSHTPYITFRAVIIEGEV